MGWVERGIPGVANDAWVAVYEGYFLGDHATQLAALHESPEQAAHSVQRVYLPTGPPATNVRGRRRGISSGAPLRTHSVPRSVIKRPRTHPPS